MALFLSGQCALLPGKANAKLSSFLDVARRGQTRVVLCCLTACVCVRQSVCAWTEWLPYSQTLFMIGMLLGSLFGGAISDRYHSLGKTREINFPPSCASSTTCPVFVLFFLWPQVRQAPNAAGVPVPAGRVWPCPCRPTPSTVLPGRALPDGRLLQLHQHQLLQPR